ncbi:histidine kinase [Nitratireductor sp. ZSWI3]|nr:histidine kinase [Nitratireductor sp. ZSWI3]MCR4266830.1 histidine kinase [Nitratireductor sp. ZSWI3]
MPTLFRLLVIIAVLAGLVYGAMLALATFVEPQTGEMSVRIPPEKLNPPE